MPITFAQAKARVCPDKPVKPGSKEHLDIMELMRQSGRIFPDDNTVIPPPPPARTLEDLRPYRERPKVILRSNALSKKDWLAVDANKKAYEDHIAKHQTVPVGYYEPEPQYREWKGKTAPKCLGPISKREWIRQLK